MELDNAEASNEDHNQVFPMAYTPDEVIDDHYGWKVDQETNLWGFRAFGALSAASFGLAFLA